MTTGKKTIIFPNDSRIRIESVLECLGESARLSERVNAGQTLDCRCDVVVQWGTRDVLGTFQTKM